MTSDTLLATATAASPTSVSASTSAVPPGGVGGALRTVDSPYGPLLLAATSGAGATHGGPTSGDPPAALAERVDRLLWADLTNELDDLGCARSDRILSPDECVALAELYDAPDLFRSTVDMARHRFGAGCYRYFDEPLPAAVAELRTAFWRHLLPVARDW